MCVSFFERLKSTTQETNRNSRSIYNATVIFNKRSLFLIFLQELLTIKIIVYVVTTRTHVYKYIINGVILTQI